MSFMSRTDLYTTVPSVFASHAHARCSSGYTFLPTIDAVTALEAEGFQVAAAKQSRTRQEGRRDFTRHMVRLRAPGLGTQEFTPEVILTNAHDGGGSFKCFGGGFRFFCFNGLIVANGRIEAISIRHHGDVLKQVIEGVMVVMSHARETGRVADHWAGVNLSLDAQVAFAQAALNLRWAPDAEGKASTPIQAQQLLTVRRNDDQGDDLWHVYNRVQEAVMTGGMEYTSVNPNAGRTKIRNLKARPIRGVNQDVAINQGLWALAEDFAKAA